MPRNHGDVKPVPSSPGQQVIDYDRASRLAMLRSCRLPPVLLKDGRYVSEGMMKAVLKAIDDRCGMKPECWVGSPTLAKDIGRSLRSVKRAVEGLVLLSLIIADTKASMGGVVCNHYRIVWSELALLCPDRPKCNGCTPRAADQSATVRDQSATVRDQSATVAHKALNATRSASSSSSPPRSLAIAGKEEEEEASCATEPGTAAIAASPASAWQTAADALRSIGIRDVRRTMRGAYDQRIEPTVIVRLVEFCRFQAGCWPPGAVVWVIANWVRGSIPEDPDIWPTPQRALRRNHRPAPPPSPPPEEPQTPLDPAAWAKWLIERGRHKRQSEDEIRATLRERGLPETLLDPQPQEPVT